jgi:hypothetical protein
MSKKTTTSTKSAPHPGTPTKLEVLMTALLSGLQNALPANIVSMVLNGTTYGMSQLETEMQAALTTFAAVRTAKASYLEASAAAKPLRTLWEVLAHALVLNLKTQIGASNTALLAKFGIVIKPRAKPSPATKTVSAARRASTLAAKKAAQQQASAASSTTVVVGPNGVQLAPAVPATPAKP